MDTSAFSSQSLDSIAQISATILLQTQSVLFYEEKPFILSSGLPSPVYVDCRRLISFPQARKTLMDFLAVKILHSIGFDALDSVAGGETAGIPFGAMIAERLALPMIYIRKKPKGYGRNARIEGVLREKQRVLLIEDMATDGGSKISFVEAIRQAGGICNHAAMVFFYDIFKDNAPRLSDAEIELLYLCSWWDILKAAQNRKDFAPKILSDVEAFLHAPREWQAAHS